jgi:hypothetical protein
VFVVLFFGAWKRFRAAPGPEATNAIRRLIQVNLLLGAATIIVASLGHFSPG